MLWRRAVRCALTIRPDSFPDVRESKPLRSRNVTAPGIFTSLRATKFPTQYRLVNVYTQLEGKPAGMAELLFQCQSVGTGDVLAEETRRVTLGLQGQRHLAIRVDQLRFPTTGSCRIVLSSGGEIVAGQSFRGLEVR